MENHEYPAQYCPDTDGYVICVACTSMFPAQSEWNLVACQGVVFVLEFGGRTLEVYAYRSEFGLKNETCR